VTVKEFQERFGIIGKSKTIKDLCDIIMQVAGADISVLIQGESGVGKEVFAKAIHFSSRRSEKKLINVNCGAIPESLLESELFGHQRGAFTGAVESRKGYFEIADGGTLFLDEIAEMPLTTQVKLLRVLETREFMRIGSETVTKVNIRIIAAANKNLENEVLAKRFRKDLFFRMKAVTLFIPPLRERAEDILPLVDHFLENYCTENKIPFPKISTDALNLLTTYHWPGNIRELKNAVETSVALNKTGVITSRDFENLLMLRSENEINRNLPVTTRISPESADRELIYRALIEIKKDLLDLKNMARMHPVTEADSNDLKIREIKPLVVLEKEAILNALEYTNWHKRKAANFLGISERTFYRKLKEYGIE